MYMQQCSYNQITAASDRSRLFCTLGVFAQHITVFCQVCYSVVLQLLFRHISPKKDMKTTMTISSSQQLCCVSLAYSSIYMVHQYIYLQLYMQLQSKLNKIIIRYVSTKQQGSKRKTMASKETENGLENNLTTTFPSNTSHKSLSTELLAPWIYSNSLTKLQKLLN